MNAVRRPPPPLLLASLVVAALAVRPAEAAEWHVPSVKASTLAPSPTWSLVAPGLAIAVAPLPTRLPSSTASLSPVCPPVPLPVESVAKGGWRCGLAIASAVSRCAVAIANLASPVDVPGPFDEWITSSACVSASVRAIRRCGGNVPRWLGELSRRMS